MFCNSHCCATTLHFYTLSVCSLHRPGIDDKTDVMQPCVNDDKNLVQTKPWFRVKAMLASDDVPQPQCGFKTAAVTAATVVAAAYLRDSSAPWLRFEMCVMQA